MDWLVKSKTEQATIGYRKLNNLLYADEIVLKAKTRKQMQGKENTWTRNSNKAKVMPFIKTRTIAEDRWIMCKLESLGLVTMNI